MFAQAGGMRIWLPAVLVLIAGGTAYAAPDGQDPPPIQSSRTSPDFLFGRPNASVGIRGNWIFSRAGSDWYDFVTNELTLERSDFNGPEFAVDVNVAVKPRLDVVAGVNFSNTSTTSEYRDLVDNNQLPIEQTTKLRGTTISGGVKYALIPRGREVGSVAWVQNTIVPYVGAGGGAHWYELTQQGDFVDRLNNLSVFTDVFQSSGWTPSAHVLGGADIKMYRRLYLTIEARYQWTKGDFGPEFVNFDPIDLSGLHVGTGINIVF